MAESNIDVYEKSVQDGCPVECYKFTYNGMNYLCTSACEDIEIVVYNENNQARTEKYFAEYIRRDRIKPGGMGSPNDCVVTVSKDHAAAKLFQGPPPETPIDVTIYRVHLQDLDAVDIALKGRVHQAAFKGSECELTVRQENWLNKELPGGRHQYYCNNTLFGTGCRLNRQAWQINAMIDKVEGIQIFSEAFANYPNGYFTDGRLYYGGYVRMIAAHSENCVRLKYPFMAIPHNVVQVLPGCDHLFRTCAMRFGNTQNFSGFPYVPPTDPEKNPTGKGAYWIDTKVIQRDTDGFVGTITL